MQENGWNWLFLRIAHYQGNYLFQIGGNSPKIELTPYSYIRESNMMSLIPSMTCVSWPISEMLSTKVDILPSWFPLCSIFVPVLPCIYPLCSMNWIIIWKPKESKFLPHHIMVATMICSTAKMMTIKRSVFTAVW